MSMKKTLALAVLLLVAVAILSQVLIPREKAAKKKGEIFSSVRAEELERVEVKNSRGSFALLNRSPKSGKELQGKDEEALTPVSSDAFKSWGLDGISDATDLDKGNFDLLLSAILQLNLDSPVPKEEASADLSLYGLQDPELNVAVTRGGKKTEIRLGKKNAYLSKRFAQVSGVEELQLVTEALFSAANKSVSEYRNRAPVSFADSDVRKVSVSSNGTALVLESETQGKWRLVEPTRATGSNSAIATLLKEIRGLQANEFYAPSEEKLKELHLDSPEAVLKVEFRETAKREPLEIKLRGYSEGEVGKELVGAYFVLSSRPTVFKMTLRNPLKDLVKPVAEVREKQLFTFATNAVTALDISAEGKPDLKLLKSGSEWTVNGKPGDPHFVKELLTRLSTLSAVGFPLESRDFGFAAPRFRATVTLASGTVSQTPTPSATPIAGGTPSALQEPKQGEGTPPRELVVGTVGDKTTDGKITFIAATGDRSEPFLITEETLEKLSMREEALVKAPTPAPTVPTGLAAASSGSTGSVAAEATPPAAEPSPLSEDFGIEAPDSSESGENVIDNPPE